MIIKDIIEGLMMPLSLCLEIMIIGLIYDYFRSNSYTGKILLTIGVALFAFFSFSSTTDIITRPLTTHYYSYDEVNKVGLENEIKYIVVLGGGNSPDQSIPVMKRVGYETLVRLVEGIRIYRSRESSNLVLSGGNEIKGASSAVIMSKIARDIGVNSKDIIIEDQSRNTEEQAMILRDLIGQEPFILVTSSNHMPRSIALFKKKRMLPIPAPTRSIERKLYFSTPNPFFPSSINMQKSESAFHEYLGIIWGRIRGQI